MPVCPTCSLCGLQPISDTGLEQAVAAPRVSAKVSIISQFSGPLRPLPAETTISASAIVTLPVSFSIFKILWFDGALSTLNVSTDASLMLSISPKELEETPIILRSSIISVEENALLVKHVLLTINGSMLSGRSITLDTKDVSIIPDRWAPKNFELADEDRITSEEFSDLITCEIAWEYFLEENSSKSESFIVIILSAPYFFKLSVSLQLKTTQDTLEFILSASALPYESASYAVFLNLLSSDSKYTSTPI